jgi:hypothetical protein
MTITRERIEAVRSRHSLCNLFNLRLEGSKSQMVVLIDMLGFIDFSLYSVRLSKHVSLHDFVPHCDDFA